MHNLAATVTHVESTLTALPGSIDPKRFTAALNC